MKDNKKPGSSDALAADSVPEMEEVDMSKEEPGEDPASGDGDDQGSEVPNTGSDPEVPVKFISEHPELSLLGAETLNTGLTIDKVVAQCEKLLDRSLKKKALYITRKSKISSGHKKSDLFFCLGMLSLSKDFKE